MKTEIKGIAIAAIMDGTEADGAEEPTPGCAPIYCLPRSLISPLAVIRASAYLGLGQSGRYGELREEETK